jgi:hypothetical protein
VKSNAVGYCAKTWGGGESAGAGASACRYAPRYAGHTVFTRLDTVGSRSAGHRIS